MSIYIDWDTLTTGPEGAELAESIRSFIDDKFQQVHLPGFIRSVRVQSFDFGSESPLVELKDISDPLPDFYEDDEVSEDDNERTDDGQPSQENVVSNVTSGDAFKRPDPIVTNYPFQKPSNILPEYLASPFLSRSSTPGIPGGTSNLSYFHLPLHSGLSGAQTPLAAVASGSPFQNWPDPPPQHDPSSPESFPNPLYSDRQSAEKKTRLEPSPLDTQITLHVKYTGSVSLTLTAALLLDYPLSSFASIPLKLSITGLSFDGVALLAYLRKKAHFCFLGRENADILVGSNSGAVDDGEKGRAEDKLGGLIREIKVESEIGKREGTKQSLKNVGKVEKFVVEQVRRIFEEEFVWPSWWTFLV